MGNLSRHSCAFHHVAITPDGHTGYGMPIGGVAAFENVILPNAVGLDIACGMLTQKTNIKAECIDKEQLKNIIAQIKRDIPMGMSHRKDDKYKDKAEGLVKNYNEYCTKSNVQAYEDESFIPAIYSQLSTLGGVITSWNYKLIMKDLYGL